MGRDASDAAAVCGPNPHVTGYRCPLLGHRVPTMLDQFGIWDEVVRGVVLGGLTEARFRQLLRARRGNRKYLVSLVIWAGLKGHARLALPICDRLIAEEDTRKMQRVRRLLRRAVRTGNPPPRDMLKKALAV